MEPPFSPPPGHGAELQLESPGAGTSQHRSARQCQAGAPTRRTAASWHPAHADATRGPAFFPVRISCCCSQNGPWSCIRGVIPCSREPISSGARHGRGSSTSDALVAPPRVSGGPGRQLHHRKQELRPRGSAGGREGRGCLRPWPGCGSVGGDAAPTGAERARGGVCTHGARVAVHTRVSLREEGVALVCEGTRPGGSASSHPHPARVGVSWGTSCLHGSCSSFPLLGVKGCQPCREGHWAHTRAVSTPYVLGLGGY